MSSLMPLRSIVDPMPCQHHTLVFSFNHFRCHILHHIHTPTSGHSFDRRSSSVSILSTSGRSFDSCSSTIPISSNIWIPIISIPSTSDRWFHGCSCFSNIFFLSTSDISIPFGLHLKFVVDKMNSEMVVLIRREKTYVAYADMIVDWML
jgi:hypothetical protein